MVLLVGNDNFIPDTRTVAEAKKSMKQDGFPYCVPDRRNLTEVEFALLTHLLEQVDGITVDPSDLSVVARCGCGGCPTILFGRSLEDEPVTSADSCAVMNWSGRADNGTLVGIGIFQKDGMPTELEAWSEDGGLVDTWPPIETIECVG